MMLKYEFRIILDVSNEPKLNEKKFNQKYCNKILDFSYKNEKIFDLIFSITDKITSLDYNVDDRDIGKSKDFRNSCLNIYNKV